MNLKLINYPIGPMNATVQMLHQHAIYISLVSIDPFSSGLQWLYKQDNSIV